MMVPCFNLHFFVEKNKSFGDLEKNIIKMMIEYKSVVQEWSKYLYKSHCPQVSVNNVMGMGHCTDPIFQK